MPSAADPINLDPNLATFARLEHSPQGSKLSFDNGAGRFSIQEPGVMQSLTRTFSRDTVTSEAFFGQPIRTVFAAAYPDRNTDGGKFASALRGLKALQASYTGDKRAALDAVISDAEHGLGKDSTRVIQLREKYNRFLIYGFSQAMFLPGTNPGVCYSFTIDWARRIILSNKDSFAASKNGLTTRSGNTLTPEQKVRMMAKVDARIRPLQAALSDYQVSGFGKALTDLSSEPQFQKFGNLAVFTLTHHAQPIANDDSGSAVLGRVVSEANKNVRAATVFLVNMKSRGKRGGHTIGVHLPNGGGLHFFDPNLGEFDFPNGADASRDAFLNEWWNLFYVQRQRAGTVQDFESWKIEGVNRLR